MKTLSSLTSACRRCRYYRPEGRRGGHCQQLNVAVQGDWTACALAIPPFSPAWESFEDIMVWQKKTLAVMQASAESAMTDVLSEATRSEAMRTEATRSEVASAYESAAMSSAGESIEASLHSTGLIHRAQPLPTAPVRTVGLNALWM